MLFNIKVYNFAGKSTPMVSIIALGILAATATTGVVTALFSITSTPPRKFDLIHWVGAFFCIAITSIFISAAIGAGKAAKQVNDSAKVASAISSGVSDSVNGFLSDNVSSPSKDFKTLAASQIESQRDFLNRKLRNAIIWSVIITAVLNSLYILLLTTAERTSKTTYTSDGFDDMDSDISNLGNFDSSFDDDLC